MESKKYKRCKKIIAIIVLLLLLISNVPEVFISTFNQTWAAAKDEVLFTIIVKDKSGKPVSSATVKAGSFVLAEDKEGRYIGIVNYDKEAEEEIISVRKTGYLAQQKTVSFLSETSAAETSVTETITMELSTAEVSGVVTDENGAAYQGAFVALGNKQTETDAQGQYLLKVDKGSYTLKATVKEDKYADYMEAVNVDADMTKDITLEMKTFEIQTPESVLGGSIMVSSKTVSYGENVTYTVTASQSGNSKYIIDSVRVNHQEVKAASGQESYQGEIKNVTSNQTIDAVFAAKESHFTLKFLDGEWLNEGEKQNLLGGSLSYDKSDGKIWIELEDKNYLSQISNSETNEEPKITRIENKICIAYGKIGTANITVQLAADDTAPSITTPDYNHNSEWRRDKLTIPIAVTDGESGVASVTVVWGGQKESIVPDEAGNYKFNIVIDKDFVGACIVTAKDQCGNTEEKSFAVQLDQTAPTILSIDKSPEQKYHNGSVEIRVRAEDLGSGVKAVYYNTGAEDLEPVLDTKKRLEDLEDGSYMLHVPNQEFFGTYYIWAEDSLGNRTEIPQKIDVNIDKTNPVIHKADTSLNSISFSNKKVHLSIKASDNISNGNDLTVYVGIKQDINDHGPGKARYNSETESYHFTLDEEGELKEYRNQIFYIWAEDEAGNVSEGWEVPVNIDTTEPKVTGIIFEKDENSVLKTMINHMTFGSFFNESVHVKVMANDDKGGAGIRQITLYYKPSRNSDELQPLTKPVYFKGVRGGESVTADFVLTKDILDGLDWKNDRVSLEDIIYAAAEDNAGKEEGGGNVSMPLSSELIVLEQNEPVIMVEPVTPGDTVVSWKGIEYQCYGEDTKLIITAKDNRDKIGKVQSGIWKMKVTINGAVIIDNTYEEIRSTEPDSLTIDTAHLKDTNGNPVAIDKEGFLHIEAETVDYANNKGKNNLHICMDYEAPTIKILEKNPGNSWSSGKVRVQAKEVADDRTPFASGVKEVRYSTGTDIERAEIAEKISDAVYQFEVDEECERVYSVWAIDKVDHVSKRKTIVVNIDKTAPEIVKFSFQAKGYQEAQGDKLKNTVKLTEYGFYFKTDVTVTVEANDLLKNTKKKNKPSSGVKFIEYYAADKAGNIALTGKKDVDKKNKISFTVPADFKGQIYAKATDRVMNTPKIPAGAMGEKNGYVHPDGSVLESYEMHQKSCGIDFHWSKSSKKDAKGQDLYKKNVPVEIVVSDTFSGIRKIEWKVTSEYDTENNQKGTLVVKNNGKLTGDSMGWSKRSQEKNLVTEAGKKVIVSNNSNDIKVWVKLTDRAGNISQKSIKFSIDKTAPRIKVTYDNDSYDKEFAKDKKYYKAERIAVITVTERNFLAKDVISSIQNAYGTAPEIGSWTEHYNAENPDETTYTTKLVYRADGDYTFRIAYTDCAGNKAAKMITDKFVVDKTAPVIQVTYQNNSAQNGSYYKEARKATVSITERNFETSRIKINGSAEKSGKKISFPGIGDWSVKGDTHTADIYYSLDGDYTFDITYTDKAGNQANKYKGDKFTVDQTKPRLTISGVANQSANQGKVVPIVSWSDINLSNNASITLTAYNRKGHIRCKGTYANISNGKKFIFDDFEHRKETDDIYTLSASVKDKAGNTSKQTIRFSVNRFGSVYTLSEEVKFIEGRYIKKERDILITETNVDKLNMKKTCVKVVKNGKAKNLVQNQDFNLQGTGEDGTWSQYIYTLYASNFADEGQYTVLISSEDKAGNINENSDERKEADISFGVDKTAPLIVPVHIEDAVTYVGNGKKIVVDITDNLVLKKTRFYLNGEKIEAKEEQDRYVFYVAQSNQRQNIKIVAVDAAGNQTEKEIKDFYVTTNLLIRWYTNKVLFISTIAAVVGFILALFLCFILKKKDGEEAEKET